MIGSYWKLSDHWRVTGSYLVMGVTGSCLVIGSYWKLFWSLGVTGSCLVMESYWKLSGH